MINYRWGEEGVGVAHSLTVSIFYKFLLLSLFCSLLDWLNYILRITRFTRASERCFLKRCFCFVCSTFSVTLFFCLTIALYDRLLRYFPSASFSSCYRSELDEPYGIMDAGETTSAGNQAGNVAFRANGVPNLPHPTRFSQPIAAGLVMFEFYFSAFQFL